jgi:hypothetical protein
MKNQEGLGALKKLQIHLGFHMMYYVHPDKDVILLLYLVKLKL